MEKVTRRRAINLTSSFAAAASLLRAVASSGQAKPEAALPKSEPVAPGSDGTTIVFSMAQFAAAGGDADAAFARASAALTQAVAGAKKGGRPRRIALDFEKGATYRIKRPVVFKQLDQVEIRGNGARVINTVRGATLLISGSNQLTIRDLTIDYDPLPFTQGTITGFDRAALQIMVEVDRGYPDDPALLGMLTDGFFKVMDRRTVALKPGARDFLSPKAAERVREGLIRVHLRWGANDRFPSQLPIAVGDTVAIANGSEHAIVVTDSFATAFIDLKVLASPGIGILENGGRGGMRLQRVAIVPGPRPSGAVMDRLFATNSDGSHFGTVEHGPTIEDCNYANTQDDAVNVHGFYYYIVKKSGPGRYLLTPKWDIGLMAGDEIETCEHGTFRSLGRSRIVDLNKRHAPELKARIAQIWKGRSETTQPDLVYEVVLQPDLPLKSPDAVTSLTRAGAGTSIRRCRFHACGRVLVKSPRSIVEDCQFTYSSGVALQAGSDIGFWSESGFADNLILRNNRFTHSITGANELTWANPVLGAISVGLVLPDGVTGFQNDFQNRGVVIEGNRIDDSFIYAIFVSNADGLRIVGNTIGQTFIRGTAFDAGGIYGIKPNSGICIGRARNVEIRDNTVARGRITRVPVLVDRSCESASVRVANNKLTG